MKSNTKNHLSENQIRNLTQKHFGKDCEITDITELKGGQFNAAYRINRGKGQDSLVLKVGVIPGTPLLTYEKDVMPTEVSCLRMLREKTTIPVPEIYACDFGKTDLNSNYFFMTAMEGVTLSSVSKKMDEENLSRIRAKQAEYMAQMHRIRGSYFGYFTDDQTKQYTTWKEAFSGMMEQVLADAQAHHTRLPYDRIRKALVKNAACLDLCKEPVLVDFDCHDGNIFVKKQSGQYVIEGILDLERAYWGDGLADFAGAFIFTNDMRREPAFLNSYLKESDTLRTYGEAESRRYLLYRMYLSVIMIAECFRYGWAYSRLQAALAGRFLKNCLEGLEK